MVKTCNPLIMGTKVQMKNDENIKGVIMAYLKDDNDELTGYSINLVACSMWSKITCDLDQVMPELEPLTCPPQN